MNYWEWLCVWQSRKSKFCVLLWTSSSRIKCKFYLARDSYNCCLVFCVSFNGVKISRYSFSETLSLFRQMKRIRWLSPAASIANQAPLQVSRTSHVVSLDCHHFSYRKHSLDGAGIECLPYASRVFVAFSTERSVSLKTFACKISTSILLLRASAASWTSTFLNLSENWLSLWHFNAKKSSSAATVSKPS